MRDFRYTYDLEQPTNVVFVATTREAVQNHKCRRILWQRCQWNSPVQRSNTTVGKFQDLSVKRVNTSTHFFLPWHTHTPANYSPLIGNIISGRLVIIQGRINSL